jgi:hypothetical protein
MNGYTLYDPAYVHAATLPSQRVFGLYRPFLEDCMVVTVPDILSGTTRTHASFSSQCRHSEGQVPIDLAYLHYLLG